MLGIQRITRTLGLAIATETARSSTRTKATSPKVRIKALISRKGGKGVDFSISPAAGAAPGIEDPFFTPKHQRHLSGMSQGMGSPLYDAATGTGIERIESKDIIALMQHVGYPL